MSEATPVETMIGTGVRSDAPSLVRGLLQLSQGRGVASIADQVLVSATNFLTTVIIGRVAGQDALGAYALAFSVMVIMLAVQQSLICLPYTVRLHQMQDGDRRRFAGSMLLQAIALGAVLSALVAVGVAVFVRSGNESVVSLALALAVTLPFVLLRDFARRASFAQLSFSDALTIDFAVLAIQIWLLLLLWRGHLLSAASSVLATGIACAAAGVFWLWHRRRSFQFAWESVPADVRTSWPLGSWVLGSQAVSVVNSYLACWLAVGMLGTAAGGLLAACYAFISLSNPLIIGIHNYLAPRLSATNADHGPRDMARVALQITYFLAAAMVLFSVMAFVLGDLFVRAVYGDAYVGAGVISGVLSLAVLAAAVGAAPDQALWVKHRPEISFWTGLVGLAAMTGFALWWMPTWGLVGGMSAMAIGNALTSALRWMALRRLIERPEKTIA